MSRVRVGVVGCGYWGPNLIRNFYEEINADLAYICDIAPGKLAKMGRRYPTATMTTRLSDLLDDRDLHAIVIATPVHTHFKLAKQALEADKHVLLTKPMCMTSQECAQLIALAKERHRILMIDHTFVYHGAIRRMKQIIDNNELGDILYFDSVRINLGLFQSDINVIWDLAPHDLSIMDYLLGQRPSAVYATGACHAGNGIEDIAYIDLKFGNNQIAHFHVSWLSPVKMRNVLVGGTKKMLTYDDLQPMEKLRIYDKGITIDQPKTDEERYQNLIQYRIGDMYAPVFDMTEALKIEVAHFIDCILTGQKPLTDGEAGMRVVQILEAANISLRTGLPQTLEGSK